MAWLHIWGQETRVLQKGRQLSSFTAGFVNNFLKQNSIDKLAHVTLCIKPVLRGWR